jgi:hypothetical protein
MLSFCGVIASVSPLKLPYYYFPIFSYLDKMYYKYSACWSRYSHSPWNGYIKRSPFSFVWNQFSVLVAYMNEGLQSSQNKKYMDISLHTSGKI